MAFVVFVFLFACAAFLLLQETHRTLVAQEKPLTVWFLDVGQGDAIFIEMPTGEQVLVDGGRGSAVLAKLGSVMWPWDRSIDVVIPTHPDADHIGGLPGVFERYDVSNVYQSGAVADTDIDRALRAAIEAEGAQVLLVSEREAFIFGNVSLDVLSPVRPLPGEFVEDRNDESVVVLLTYGDTSVLLTGDAESGAEATFGALAGDVDVLKAGHHGSRTSSSESFLQIVTPEIAIISAGADNSYGHPHPAVLDRLNRAGAKVLRTDLDGDILLRSWGGEPEVFASPLPF